MELNTTTIKVRTKVALLKSLAMKFAVTYSLFAINNDQISL